MIIAVYVPSFLPVKVFTYQNDSRKRQRVYKIVRSCIDHNCKF